MDKGLEKINELTNEIEKLLNRVYELEKEERIKSNQQMQLNKNQEDLNCKIDELNSNRDELLYKQKNIKKWKRNTILGTIGYLILFTIIMATLYLSVEKNISFSNVIIPSLVLIPSALLCGENNNYYSNKKYLKTHRLEDIEEEIKENEKDLSLNKKKKNEIDDELIELLNNKKELKNQIQLFSIEIENIKNIRKDIIDDYLKDNKKLDRLLNKGYKTFTKDNEKQKVKVKEK